MLLLLLLFQIASETNCDPDQCNNTEEQAEHETAVHSRLPRVARVARVFWCFQRSRVYKLSDCLSGFEQYVRITGELEGTLNYWLKETKDFGTTSSLLFSQPDRSIRIDKKIIAKAGVARF